MIGVLENKERIENLLKRNDIDMEQFMSEAYSCLIVSLFERLVEEMSNEEYKRKFKLRLLGSEDKILTIKKVIYELTNCKIDDEEASVIYKYVYANLTKRNARLSYDDDFRESLLDKQNKRCAICNKDITISSSELDHVIPWIFVGDELGRENLQMLCSDCNRRKSKYYAYNLKMFLVEKR